MAELTKKELKEVFQESLEPFAKAVQEDFRKVDERFDKMDGRLDKMEGRLDRVEFDLTEVKAGVQWMKDNASELFAKLDRFVALLEKQEQETAALAAHVRRLEERVAKLESSKK